jgi:hypothetical protein
VNSPSLSKLDSQIEANPVEMVTVPVMGAEWKKDEMLDMRKATHRRERAEQRAQKWKEWRRGERGLCGRYFTRKFTVFFFFFLCVAYVLLPYRETQHEIDSILQGLVSSSRL